MTGFKQKPGVYGRIGNLATVVNQIQHLIMNRFQV